MLFISTTTARRNRDITNQSDSVIEWRLAAVRRGSAQTLRQSDLLFEKRTKGLRHFAEQMEVIRHQRIGQDPYAAKGLQPSHQEHKSFGLWGTVAGGLKNELTVDHSGNAVVRTLTLSLDAREPHGREADYTEQKIKV